MAEIPGGETGTFESSLSELALVQNDVDTAAVRGGDHLGGVPEERRSPVQQKDREPGREGSSEDPERGASL